MIRFTLRHAAPIIALTMACLVAFHQHETATGLMALALLLAYGAYVNGPAWRQHCDDEARDARERAEDKAADEQYKRECEESDARHALLMHLYDRDCDAWDAAGQGVWGTPSFPSEAGRVVQE